MYWDFIGLGTERYVSVFVERVFLAIFDDGLGWIEGTDVIVVWRRFL